MMKGSVGGESEGRIERGIDLIGEFSVILLYSPGEHRHCKHCGCDAVELCSL